MAAMCSGKNKGKDCQSFAVFAGLCRNHGGAVPKKEVARPNLVFACTKGEVKPDEDFLALGSEGEYAKRIEHLLTSGSSDAKGEMVHGVMCLHDTQAGNNLTVWYRWTGNTMTVYGLGNHTTSNSKYEMAWFDGSNKKWTRK